MLTKIILVLLKRNDTMKNDLFIIGPLTIHGYGLMIAIGIIVANIVALYRAKNLKLSCDNISSLIFWCLLGGIFGAKLLYWITQAGNILHDPKILFNVTEGFVVYGGIIGGILTGFLYCKNKQMNFLQYFDLLIPSVALAQGFGRIGCFMAGCCYGAETTNWFGVAFPYGSLAPSGIRLIPTQLISSSLDFLLFAILIFYGKRKTAVGQIAAVYLILHSIGRFFIEFLRGDLIRGNIGIISTSQFISIWIFICGVCMLFKVSSKKILVKRRS